MRVFLRPFQSDLSDLLAAPERSAGGSDLSDKSELSDVDLDVMLYILSLPDLSEIRCALQEIIVQEINTMIEQSFLPLAILPKTQSSSEEIYFDEM